MPFLTDFARSCNTAFVGLSGRLSPSDITAAANAFGFAAKWSLPLATFAGQFPEPADTAEPLATFVFADHINTHIGTDLNAGFEYRPFLSNNAIILVGVSTLVPGSGFKALFNGKDLSGWKGLVADPPKRAKMSPEELATAQAFARSQFSISALGFAGFTLMGRLMWCPPV